MSDDVDGHEVAALTLSATSSEVMTVGASLSMAVIRMTCLFRALLALSEI